MVATPQETAPAEQQEGQQAAETNLRQLTKEYGTYKSLEFSAFQQNHWKAARRVSGQVSQPRLPEEIDGLVEIQDLDESGFAQLEVAKERLPEVEQALKEAIQEATQYPA